MRWYRFAVKRGVRHVPAALFIISLTVSLFRPQFGVSAAPGLTITPITWNVVGLDSNEVSVGPADFPVGARVCPGAPAQYADRFGFTVTGAACMFRRELLSDALPFPPQFGHMFHDHWLAILALSRGRLGYVDRPLYDYVQHGGNVIGHVQATGAGRLRMLARLGQIRLRTTSSHGRDVLQDAAPGFLRIDGMNGFTVPALAAGRAIATRKVLDNGAAVIAIHNSHHLGQIVTLRQLMGLWQPRGGGWTW